MYQLGKLHSSFMLGCVLPVRAVVRADTWYMNLYKLLFFTKLACITRCVFE